MPQGGAPPAFNTTNEPDDYFIVECPRLAVSAIFFRVIDCILCFVSMVEQVMKKYDSFTYFTVHRHLMHEEIEGGKCQAM